MENHMNHRTFTPRLANVAQRAQPGVTLIETAVVTSVLAVVTGLAAPRFESLTQRQHLQGAAAQLETVIHCTRMLAVARNAPLRISFEANAGASCYVIHTGSVNQCSCTADGAAVCQGDAQAERAVRFAAGGPVSVKSNSRSVRFDPVGHQHADGHDATHGAQRHGDPPGDEHHGSCAFVLACARVERLSRVLNWGAANGAVQSDQRLCLPDRRCGGLWSVSRA
jgi:type IV fimbrial biogenesis protein FimT